MSNAGPTAAVAARTTRGAVARLRQVTGFVTVFGQDADSRLSVFARLWHVGRVAWTSRLIASAAPGCDVRRVNTLAWCHDLNRWPFAHNTEVGHFDQSGDIPGYFATLVDSPLSDDDLSDIQKIHAKDAADLSLEARVVLAADVLAGVVEDQLLLTAGLNVRPTYIPRSVGDLLGFHLTREPWRRRCTALALSFHGPRSAGAPAADPIRFRREMNALFRELTIHSWRSIGRGDLFGLLQRATQVRRSFLKDRVFPINNELVCHSSWLRNDVMPAYRAVYESSDLTFITEDQFVERFTAMNGTTASPADFLPDMDAVRDKQPDLAFIGPRGECS